MAQQDFEQLAEDFAFLDDWEDRYRYIIELGKALPSLPEEERTDQARVHGCVSQVWIVTDVDNAGGEDAVVHMRADSDAMIVRGLIAILLTLVSGRKAREILDMDIEGAIGRLGLKEHLTPQRANGLAAMIARIKAEARRAVPA